jgi:hypothetical protein
MKAYELDAALKVVRDAIIDKMQKAGYGGFVNKVAEHNAELMDIVEYGLQAAEDERKKREGGKSQVFSKDGME